MLFRLTLLALICFALHAQGPVYYLLWFDTEDYVEPSADDAALRLATDLEALGVRATFKVVGEKARVLESRGRKDVIRALSRHDIGYHAENHSIPPSPAVYMQPLGLLEGAAEFESREGRGARDIKRIFGVTPSCYGQPGSSWGPQSNIALRRMGIPVYMDDGSQVGFANQPFWYMGILYVFNLGSRFTLRADLNDAAKLPDAIKRFDDAAAYLRANGGGVIHTYYHPTEFVATEFWDAVNFPKGRYTAPSDYKRPRLRTKESAEQAYRLMLEFVKHIRDSAGVRIITARQLPQIFDDPNAVVDVTERRKLADSIDVSGRHSAADQLLALLGFQGRYVDGPAGRVDSTVAATSISRELFNKGKQEAVDYIERQHRLPSHVWFGVERLSLADFTATLAGDDGGASVAVRRGKLDFEKNVATDPKRSFNWAIHPDGFDGSSLLEMGRWQAWTLKPAKLR